MQKFSQQALSDNHNLIKTDKDTAIFEAVSFTGLPENHIKLLFETDNLLEFTCDVKNNLSHSFSISEEIEKILSAKNSENVKINELNSLVDNVKNYPNLDSVELLNSVSDLLIINDPKAKEYIVGENKLKDAYLTDLNESSNFGIINFENNIEESKQLFESLKDLLSRQNKRWGNAYRLTNTYNGILYYLDNEIQRLMLMNDIVTSDTNFSLNVIKSFINEEFNPLFKDYSIFKNVCTDIQTLDFDLILLVHHFILNNTEALEFISQSTLRDYQNSVSALISSISSSIFTSKILSDEIKNKLDGMFDDNKEKNSENTPLINILVDNIDFAKFTSFTTTNKISVKAAHDMIWLINSSTIDFNMRLRPMFKSYVTKSLELVKRVDEAKFRLNKFKSGN